MNTNLIDQLLQRPNVSWFRVLPSGSLNVAIGIVVKPAELEALRTEADSLRKDAERYRWLRDDAMTGTKHDPAVLKDGPADCCEFMFGDELDEAIDAAMGAKA